MELDSSAAAAASREKKDETQTQSEGTSLLDMNVDSNLVLVVLPGYHVHTQYVRCGRRLMMNDSNVADVVIFFLNAGTEIEYC